MTMPHSIRRTDSPTGSARPGSVGALLVEPDEGDAAILAEFFAFLNLPAPERLASFEELELARPALSSGAYDLLICAHPVLEGDLSWLIRLAARGGFAVMGSGRVTARTDRKALFAAGVAGILPKPLRLEEFCDEMARLPRRMSS